MYLNKKELQINIYNSLISSSDRDRIRTCDRLLRRQMLYPAELRDQWFLKQKPSAVWRKAFAVRTRLELATPCVTGRYSNQLNYRTKIFRTLRFFRTGRQM